MVTVEAPAVPATVLVTPIAIPEATVAESIVQVCGTPIVPGDVYVPEITAVAAEPYDDV